MERLVEMKAAVSPEEIRLMELVAASERTVLSDATKAEVLGQVLARQQARRGRPSWVLRPALGAAVLLLAGVTTAATLGRHWIVNKLQLAPAAPVAAPQPHRSPPAAEPPPALVPSVVEPPPAPDHPIAGARRSRPGRGEDPSRVVAAIQTLRNDHDPVRAGKLLDQYLKVYPHGALTEEALALSIEAAAARHDPARAAAFGERYLKEYPNGRFRRAAEQARKPALP